MRPDVARDALLATHGGLSLEWCAVICHISHGPLSPICALGHTSLVTVLTRCGLPLPTYILADEKHSVAYRARLLTHRQGRVLWHLGYSESKSTAAFTESLANFSAQPLSMSPRTRCGGPDRWLRQHRQQPTDLISTGTPGLLPAPRAQQAPDKLIGVSTSVRKGLRSKFHALLHRCRQRKSLRVVASGQHLRHFADRITATVGEAHGARVRQWFQAKKAGWYTVLADPQMPAMSTVLDQAHNALDRKLFAMKGFHHPGGSQAAFLTGLAHLYNLIPYQCRALNAGQCGVEVKAVASRHRTGC